MATFSTRSWADIARTPVDVKSMESREQRVMYILRGLPGSGKSTRAAQISRESTKGCTIVSADIFFIDFATNTYRYDPKLVGVAHDYAVGECHKAAMRKDWTIVVDNTHIHHRDYQRYADIGRANGYTLVFETIGGFTPEDQKTYAARNIHGVTLEAIQRMAATFEK